MLKLTDLGLIVHAHLSLLAPLPSSPPFLSSHYMHSSPPITCIPLLPLQAHSPPPRHSLLPSTDPHFPPLPPPSPLKAHLTALDIYAQHQGAIGLLGGHLLPVPSNGSHCRHASSAAELHCLEGHLADCGQRSHLPVSNASIAVCKRLATLEYGTQIW